MESDKYELSVKISEIWILREELKALSGDTNKAPIFGYPKLRLEYSVGI
jgi:hypothetical protein